MSASKAKGYAAEKPVADFLAANGWPSAERRQAGSAQDRGDVLGTPGVAWEVRNRRTVELPKGLRDAEQVRGNSGADVGVLVVKPVGVGDTRIAEWAAVLPLGELCRLLRMAGFGDPCGSPGGPSGRRSS